MLRAAYRACVVGLLLVSVNACGYPAQAVAQEHKTGAPESPRGHAEEVLAGGGEQAAETDILGALAPKPTLAIWTLVVFLGVMAVLGRYAWKPLLVALHNREQHLEHVLSETERARNESEAQLAEHRKLMSRAADEVRAILDKARQEAQATADHLLKQAQGEAELAKQRAARDIAQARDQALAEIWEKTADMAVTVAGRVLAKELNETDHRRLLDAAISELPAAAQSNGHGGKRS
jgi:F-type H+-transporting ATPase subunit b